MHDLTDQPCGYTPPSSCREIYANLSGTAQEPSDREQIAALEHEQWMEWAQNIAAHENLSEERRARWRTLMVPYEQLTEEQKDQDRKWADKVMATSLRLRAGAAEQPFLLDREALDLTTRGAGTLFWPSAGQVKAMAREIMRLQDAAAKAPSHAGRAVDDALDAADVPQCYERGSMTTAQRVEWLAGQRDKWRGYVTPAEGRPSAACPASYSQRAVDEMVNAATKPLHAEIESLRSKWDSTDAAHRELDAAGAPKETFSKLMERGLATVPKRVRWLACENRRHTQDAADANRRHDEQLRVVQQQANRIEQVEKALGLLTTLHPTMVVRADDPIGMAKEIHAHVTLLAKQAANDPIGLGAANIDESHKLLDGAGVPRSEPHPVYGAATLCLAARVDRLVKMRLAGSAENTLASVDARLDGIRVPRSVPAVTGHSVTDRVQWLDERLRAYANELARVDGIRIRMPPYMIGEAEPMPGYRILDRIKAVVDRLLEAEKRLAAAEPDVLQNDVRDLLRALGLGDHARPVSPHRVVQDEILPAVRELQRRMEHADEAEQRAWQALGQRLQAAAKKFAEDAAAAKCSQGSPIRPAT